MDFEPTNRILGYGKPGIGKSTLIAMLIAYVWKKYGLKSRIVGGDGGGSKAYDALVQKGIAEYWPINQWDDKSIFSYLELAGRGYWPVDPEVPGSELLPPKQLFRECPKCKEKLFGAMPASCPACKDKFPQGVRFPLKAEVINGAEEIGAYCFDGLTFYGNAMMENLRVGNPSGGNAIQLEGYTVANAGQSHYGAAQTYLSSMIANFQKIPTKFVFATALERRGEDDMKKPLYGPALPGKALTDVAPGWFTDCFHLEGESTIVDGIEKPIRMVYMAKHFPKDTIPHGFVAKTSAPIGGGMPDKMEMKANENFWEQYFGKLEAAFKKSEEQLIG